MRYGLRPVAGGRSFGLAAQQTEVAEELGFDGVFFGEHHGFPDYWPSPVLALTALARSTTRIRLGASVLILPLHHPVRLAEELAMLDCLSDGRLVVGLGQGWASHEFDAFSVPRPQLGEIFTEGVSLLKRLWASQPTTFHGSFYSLKAYTISPAVVQEPHPPIWLGGNAPSAIRRAAALADGWLCGDIETIEELAKGMAVYEAALQDVGRKEPVTVFPAGRHIVLAASSRQAWQEAESYFASTYAPLLDRKNPKVDKATRRGLAGLVQDRHIVGDPLECAEFIRRLQQEIGINYLILKFSRRDSIDGFVSQVRLFVDKVIPRV